MTNQHDPVEEFLDGYFDYIDGVGEEPSLDQLTPEERREVEQLIESLTAARGINPDSSRPSLAALMDRARSIQASNFARSLATQLRDSLQRSVDLRGRVADDAAAQAAGLSSALIIYARGLRIRVIIAGESADFRSDYGNYIPSIAAVFGAFPDTNAVLITTTEAIPVGAIVDRDDIVTAVEAPSGRSRPPRIRRPLMASADACVHYLLETMPSFEPFEYLSSQHSPNSADVVDVDHVVGVAVAEVAMAGARARLLGKKQAWSAMGPLEAAFISKALRSALNDDFDEASFRNELEELVDVA